MRSLQVLCALAALSLTSCSLAASRPSAAQLWSAEDREAAPRKPTAEDLAPRFVENGLDAGKMVDAPAERASSLSFDGWAGCITRRGEIKLGVAWVPAVFNGRIWRGELQVGENVIGPAIGLRLPLSVFTEALSISVGAAYLYDVGRSEWTPSVYVARLVF